MTGWEMMFVVLFWYWEGESRALGLRWTGDEDRNYYMAEDAVVKETERVKVMRAGEAATVKG